jgi:uncharacterized protein YqjF (DUF2071 family)
MPSVSAPRGVALPMVVQSWRQVTFVHWPLTPAAVAATVPAPLTVDTFDGAAWVSLVAFSTTCEVAGVVPVPGPRRFPETNVRTYVRGPDGRDGLYFLSLDVTNRANALLGRCLGLPYHVGDMTVDGTDALRYSGRRRHGRDIGYELVAVPGDPVPQTDLDTFLTGRWSAYVVRAGLVVRHDVEHDMWALHEAHIASCEQGLVGAAGLLVNDASPRAHYAAGVTARLAPGYVSRRR